jgi:hypothetical protein
MPTQARKHAGTKPHTALARNKYIEKKMSRPPDTVKRQAPAGRNVIQTTESTWLLEL